ncbi:hypothetical protein [Phenylobacterium sp. J367]|uniref:hypothetical protein n=1 Tax=Phenylobacterium sp. J367 TaxID=2898435 RepID=UPI002151EDD1|nr:hypothetical protein [Phenylobacterium sp. J367]MCR5881297.1 hypothetical protein [Phenylobacterium sp. J367]
MQQFEPAKLAEEIGPDYQTLYAAKHDHITPAGNLQRFSWCVLQRGGSGEVSPGAACAHGEG